MMCFAGCFQRFRTGRTHGKGRRISRESRGFRRSQKLADPKHDIVGVIAPLGLPPQVYLLGEVAGRLPREGWISGPQPLTTFAVTTCAGGQAPSWISARKEDRRGAWSRAAWRWRQRGIMTGHGPALARRKLSRDPAHLGMPPAPVCICFELAKQISLVERSKAGASRAISATREPVTREAGVHSTGLSAAKRHQLAASAEAVGRSALNRRAGRDREHDGWQAQMRYATAERHHAFAEPAAECIGSAIAIAMRAEMGDHCTGPRSFSRFSCWQAPVSRRPRSASQCL